MWVPATEAELVAVVTSGSLEEGPTFDAKKEISSKSTEIAKDIAAMANDGGVLIYGIDEDDQGRPTKLNPIPLDGQRERISSIVQTAIAEPPKVSITTIPTVADPAVGYLIVAVPVSERAPHMVVVKGDNRFYGRSASGNTILSEGDVARLYERRRRWEGDRQELLRQEIAQAPYPPTEGFAFLHLVARPVAGGSTLLEDAKRDQSDIKTMLTLLIEQVKQPAVFPRSYSPDFDTPSRWIFLADGLFGRLDYPGDPHSPRALARTLNLQVDFDGAAHLFCGRVADTTTEGFVFFSQSVAGNVTRFLLLLGLLFDRARYLGPVDVGVGITGLKGSVLYSDNWRFEGISYPHDEYLRTAQVSVLELKNDPIAIAKGLLMPLFQAFAQGPFDPFPKQTS